MSRRFQNLIRWDRIQRETLTFPTVESSVGALKGLVLDIDISGIAASTPPIQIAAASGAMIFTGSVASNQEPQESAGVGSLGAGTTPGDGLLYRPPFRIPRKKVPSAPSAIVGFSFQNQKFQVSEAKGAFFPYHGKNASQQGVQYGQAIGGVVTAEDELIDLLLLVEDF